MRKKILCLLCLMLLFNANAEITNDLTENNEYVEIIESEEEIIDIDEIIEENYNTEVIEEKEEELIETQQVDEIVEEVQDIELDSFEEEKLSFEAMEDIVEDRYNYNITLDNFIKYNLVALQNAFINSHTRGSIWIGGVLTSSDWCGVDDGSIDHEPSGSESYIYINESNMYFQGRTNNQSTEAYKLLTQESVEETQNYWGNLINKLPNNEKWIYIKPDENGYINLLKWDYQNEGSDESIQSIEKIYWTDAAKIDMGGLAGHLIAPFADINITWCNYRGTIIGKNINTNGEGHINYWKPEINEPTPSPTPTPTLTPSPTPISTPTVIPTPTEPTISPTFTPSPTPTPTPTMTPTTEPTSTPIPTTTLIPTPMPTKIPKIKPTKTPKPVPEIVIELNEQSTPTVIPTLTPIPTIKPTIMPERRQQIIEYIKMHPPTSNFDIELLTEQELEDLIKIFDYKVPIYNRPLPTGDSIPTYVFIFAAVGIIILFILSYMKGVKKYDIKEGKQGR